jgi:hypothetical protein
MPTRRPRASLTLVGAALVLLLSIAIGQRIGDHILSSGTDRQPTVVRPLATPVPEQSEGPVRDWHHEQIVSVATDPAFPDPRVTRPPTPTPAPTRTPAEPALTPAPTAPPYTSPPLALPLASHAPDESPEPEETATP